MYYRKKFFNEKKVSLARLKELTSLDDKDGDKPLSDDELKNIKLE